MPLSEGAARLLEARDILPKSYFRFGQRYYYLTSSLRVLDIDGRERPFGEDELWDSFDLLKPVTRDEFESARARQRAELGEVSRKELKALAERFTREYTEHHEENRWQFLCSYGEETIRRVTAAAAEAICREHGLPGVRGPSEARRVFQEVIVARARRRIASSSD